MNPYHIRGPAIISFSGGRTSGYMLYQILDAYNGQLPHDIHVCFQNTGKEMPETLDFIRKCDEEWGVDIVWLEHNYTSEGKHCFDIVNFDTASRNGEPFKRLVDRKNYLPNPVKRFCTVELKIKTVERYCRRVLEWDEWDTVVGLRADEMWRVSKTSARNGKDRWESVMPLADAGVTKATVKAFWDNQLFDLALPNINGKTPHGNCDLCFLKGAPTIMGIIRDQPELAKWWSDIEADTRASKPSGARFRSDRPSYAEMLRLSQDQGDLFADDSTIPCFCTD